MIREIGTDITTLCAIAGVSTSGYYKWLQHADEPDRDVADHQEIKAVFDTSKGKYGWRSIKMRLPHMNHKKIQRIMRKYGLRAKVRRRNPYKQMMQRTREHRVAPNLLERSFLQFTPYTVFCTDITYLPFRGGFAYLSVVKDIASGEIVAWQVSTGLAVELVTTTLRAMHALPSEHALMHSDQGFHYTSPRFTSEVQSLGMTQSMSRKGTCIDNAPIESFFGHMKDELEYLDCTTFEQLRVRIDEYM